MNEINIIGTIKTILIQLINDHIEAIIFMMLATILVVIIMLIDKVRRKHIYTTWKKQTLNLWIYERTWERVDDELLVQLFDENKRLETENKALKREASKLSIFLLIGLSISLLYLHIQHLFKKSE